MVISAKNQKFSYEMLALLFVICIYIMLILPKYRKNELQSHASKCLLKEII